MRKERTLNPPKVQPDPGKISKQDKFNKLRLDKHDIKYFQLDTDIVIFPGKC